MQLKIGIGSPLKYKHYLLHYINHLQSLFCFFLSSKSFFITVATYILETCNFAWKFSETKNNNYSCQSWSSGVVWKKLVLKIMQTSQKNSMSGSFFLLIKSQAEPLPHVFYYEFCEIFQNSFCIKHMRMATSAFPAPLKDQSLTILPWPRNKL